MQNDEPIGIEEEFRKSWDKLEDLQFEQYFMELPGKALLALISEMRSRGYDEWLYASRIYSSLLLSRSQTVDFRRTKSWLIMEVDLKGGLSVGGMIAGRAFQLDKPPSCPNKCIKSSARFAHGTAHRLNKMPKLIIIGGGIAGLAAAWYAQQANISYTLIEASNRWGGLIRTERVDDFVIEYGPDAFISRKPHALQLARELGLEPIPVNKTPERIYVLLKKRLVPLPDGLGLIVPTKLKPFLRSPLLSWYGKLRLLAEQFIPASPITEDESLASFISRRMGKEALVNIAEPLLAGVYNAEMDKQSILATFPQYRALEKQHGSLIRGMKASTKTASEDSGLMSFKTGMAELIDTLLSKLSGDLRLNTSVNSIDDGYRIGLSTGEILDADSLILATPAHISACLLEKLVPEAAMLREIRYAGIGSISLAYRLAEVPRPLDAFGVVIPGNQGRPIDGMQWNSSKWPERAPEGMALIRVFFGGANSRFMLEKPDSEVLAIVREELREILGISAAPVFHRIGKWENAYPQYELGHLERVAAIESALPPNVALAGNAYRGVGIPDTIKTAINAIQKLTR